MTEHATSPNNQEHRSNMLTSARVIIEGLAVAGLIWLASSVTQQNVSIARLQTQVAQLNATLADVPRMSREIAAVQVTEAEHGRRLDRIEEHQP